MHVSKRSVIISVALIGVVMMAILSAGCVGSFSYCPDEVKVHNSIIAVDEYCVGEDTIRNLLFSPNDYESSYISAIDNYLPSKNPVIEIGAKFGVITAFIDDKINQNVAHVAVEPNPEFYNLLMETIKLNSIILSPVNASITYLPDENGMTEYTYTTGFSGGFFSSSGSPVTVTVPATTISELIAKLNEQQEYTNISLMIDDDEVSNHLFTYEPNLSKSVEYIFMNIKDPTLVKGIVKQASLCKYTNITYPAEGSDGYTVLVFKRTVTSDGKPVTVENAVSYDEIEAAELETSKETKSTKEA